MFGARARAAEYHAFQKAIARQASREAEEHKLPPKPAPISLSAFTKNPQLNRNKGPKAWKPLILEDTPEDDNDILEDNEDTLSTPTRQKGVDRSGSISHDSDIALVPSNPQPTWLDANDLSATIPTAPKAMLRTISQAPSPLVNPTPRRIQPHAIVKQAQQSGQPSVNSSPSNLSGISGFPYPGLTWWFDSHGMPVLGPAAIPLFQPGQHHGNLMVPDDISPSKQENKLASLSHEHMGPSSGFVIPHHHLMPMPEIIESSMVAPMTFAHYEEEAGPGNHSQTWSLAPGPIERPVMQHVNSDSAVNMDGHIPNASSLPMPNAIRRFSYPTAVGEPMEQGSITKPAAHRLAQHATHPVLVLPDEEPYDRKNKMQSFVAAQQALAKTGKTVLRNPDLHRVKVLDSASPAHSTSETTTPERTRLVPTYSPESIIIRKPPPGLDSQLHPHQAFGQSTSKASSPFDTSTLREIFGVGKEDWFELKPVSKNQRMMMNRVMRMCAKAQSPDAPQGFLQGTKTGRKESLQNWMRIASRDNKPATGTRKLFEQVSKECHATRASIGGSGDGASSDQSSDAEIEGAAIRAVGDILANLTESADSSDSGVDLANMGCKYKPAPEYAIERGALLMGNSGSTSFFEENTGGFYSAPSRIARDPRFRPAGKEAVKVKSEEEWKVRHDMYGRRRL
ncbi:uncharacterized protein Z520_10633 [Fonsecaea multimorphosa CBS 102226]|uniref:Uncharacterized protein n=1 Tax=Fonsecaea multimorphosa CBS 102226 TaxID=1442371 RepID=A0A0D2JKC6_9EURO|nr:uncharacterized protein Z520_10633 [Fonsecaea multimorphosa CBS 102226]KIX93727.1 hypothetical protein Z520_10633 [Fonsecaea multimorphosa CBS 102226]OAL19835.1 hypothetical protein AYO22_09362 [Fonsecaea multimorphosa]